MEQLLLYWPLLIIGAVFALNLAGSCHVVLHKNDARAAISWIAILWFAPFFGCLLYYIFGINRIERRARRLRRKPRHPKPLADAAGTLPVTQIPALPTEAAHLVHFVTLCETVTGQPLGEGNTIEPLWDGDQTYAAMLDAIDRAQQSVSLCMYIFNNDRTGNQFAAALGRAVARRVEVRVLIDDVGARQFSWRPISTILRRAGVPTARFLPTFWPGSFKYANLRNHRKLMIVDGRIGFTGGMNITDEYRRSLQTRHAMHDAQFRLEGPIVASMQEVFAEDWRFTTGESLDGDRWFPPLEPCGALLARGVLSGPDEDHEKLRLVILGALSSARSRVVIVTPYFLPDADLISALNITALRGVQVDIFLPRESDLRLVGWAATAQLGQVLSYGCRVWIVPGPFTHTKLMLVDGIWTLLGSANWDARSLRLNFEFNIECYDRALAQALEGRLHENFAHAERMTLAKLNARPYLTKLRDGMARLLMPYL